MVYIGGDGSMRSTNPEVDAEGKPTRVTGIQLGDETKEFDAVICAADLPGVKKVERATDVY